MRELLPLLQKPSHYAGIEDGVCVKDAASVKLRIALAFPDTYEVGMSYLGQKILYGIVNARPRWWAERVMCPEMDAAKLLLERNAPLATLESDTPLKNLNAICFSVTHELCFTDILHMLDLAQVPLRAENRGESLKDAPLVIAGGGAMLGAEPLMPFVDLAALGDGEELLPDILELLEKCLEQNVSRQDFLRQAANIPGVYAPSFFSHDANGRIKANNPDYRPGRRIVADLDAAPYPVGQVAPVGAVHNRLSLEIARGCTRGCRFCHAGIVYRPARERNIENLKNILNECLSATGYEEVSFLSLSAGDFSGLRSLYEQTYEKCAREQISLALPSLRVGSVEDGILAKMASLRRTGITLAPEAGSQRLRDVINKGITGEQLLEHVAKLYNHGWQQVKFYFMIGLPTETDADLEAIFDLCRKTRDIGGKGAKKIQITASLSTFVPKPFTPFQWEAQISLEETRRRIQLLRDLFRGQKFLKLRWHRPEASFLEGIMSRADRRMAEVVEKAYRKGAVFCSWDEHFTLAPWLEALAECGMDAESFLAARDINEPLPWSHLECGVSEKFLLRERNRALMAQTTEDCRYGLCGNCGVCDTKAGPSLLPRKGNAEHKCRLVFERRDQSAEYPASTSPQTGGESLSPHIKAAQYRIWHCKKNNYAFLSQLELQAILERAMRRAGIPLSFSQGFHPLPLMSFGRALPVGMESHAEWLAVTLAKNLGFEEIKTALNKNLPPQLGVEIVEATDMRGRTEQAIAESFIIALANGDELALARDRFAAFQGLDTFEHRRMTKKGEKVQDIRPMLASWRQYDDSSIVFMADWRRGYISPAAFASAILGRENLKISKAAQIFADGAEYGIKNIF